MVGTCAQIHSAEGRRKLEDDEDGQYTSWTKAGPGNRMHWTYREAWGLRVLGKLSMVSFSQSPRLNIVKSFFILPFSSPCSYLLVLTLECSSVNCPFFFHFYSHCQVQATNMACLDHHSNKLLNVLLLLMQIHPVWICHDTARSRLLFFFFFLQLYLWHMEVPWLVVESKLQLLAYSTTTATAMQESSHIGNLCHSLQQCQILNPLSEAREWTYILMDTSQVLNPLSCNGSSHIYFVSPLFNTCCVSQES